MIHCPRFFFLLVFRGFGISFTLISLCELQLFFMLVFDSEAPPSVRTPGHLRSVSVSVSSLDPS